jgi:ubiquinone/menaquinone biosynthesis C-methylase UbiE
MSHVFDPKHKHVLDDPGRKKWQDPELLIDWLSIKGDETIADIGAGTGFFAIPFAAMSPSIKVYAVDVSSEMLQTLKDKQQKAGLDNINRILSDENGIPIDDAAADIVLAADVFHELVGNTKIFEEIKRILKDDGRFIVVDWIKKRRVVFGPPFRSRKTPEEVTSILKDYGFALRRQADLYPKHYTLEFTKH